jgi:hypothetical protein
VTETSMAETVATKTAVTKNGEAPVAEDKTVHTPRLGEWFIVGFLLLFFGFAYLLSQDWPFRAALFPKMVAAVGFALAALRILGLVLEIVRGRRATVAVTPSKTAAAVDQQPQDSSPEAEQVRTAAAAGSDDPADAGSAVTIVDDDAEEDESMEYVFATAGGRAWIEAIAWIAVFFLSFFVLGAFITVPLFALVYLRFSGKASWLSAGIYAAVTGLLIFYVFRELVYIPLPESVFPFLDF